MQKRLLLSIAVILLIAVLGFELYARSGFSATDRKVESFWSRWGKPPAELDRSKPLREQTRRISIGGHILDLPLMYLSYPLDEGEEQDGLALEMWLIDGELRAIPELPREMVRDRTNWGKNSISVLVLPLPDPDRTVADMVETWLNTSIPKYQGHAYGLDEYKRISKEYKKPMDDLYVEKQNEEIKSLLYCNFPGTVPAPGCGHVFQSQGLQYTLHYRRPHLPNWKLIQSKFIELIASLETPNSPYFQTNVMQGEL